MKALFTACVFFVFNACGNLGKVENTVINTTSYLHDIDAFTTDSLVNVVIEIPAGTSQKWEINKVTGQIEWEQVTPDSFRVINYLPYPANYGFVPRTLLPEGTGGDGDPVDVFVLGERIERGIYLPCKIIGFIEMTDDGEDDSKLIALPVDIQWKNISSLEELNHYYPGVMDILHIWLSYYKGPDKIKILSENDERDANRLLRSAHSYYIDLNNNN
ncbi:MAG: inorganic diphosphatase [Bacteroidales bacterium]